MEVEFYEVRRFLGALTYFVPWRTYIPLTQEYVVLVTWAISVPLREGAGQLPALLLDRGQLPDRPTYFALGRRIATKEVSP